MRSLFTIIILALSATGRGVRRTLTGLSCRDKLADRLVMAVLLFAPAILHGGDYEDGVAAFEKKDYDRAAALFAKAAAVEPQSAKCHFYLGMTQRRRKAYDASIECFTIAIKHEAKPAHCYFNRGEVYLLMKKHEEALADFNKAVRLEPDNAIPYIGRGYAYVEAGAYSKGIEDYESALKLDPKQPGAANNLAWVLATCPNAKIRDGKRALQFAKQACEITDWKQAFELSTLAAAYAEIGDFRNAAAWQSKAIETGFDDPDDHQNAKSRLTLFERQQPYRTDAPKAK